MKLTKKFIATLKDAALKLKSSLKRAFMARATKDYFGGSARKVERELGWSREAVKLGMKELETGIICIENFAARGRKKAEEISLNLKKDIEEIVGRDSQIDPTFRSTLKYSRKSAQAIRKALINEKGYTDTNLPKVRTINNILNRLGYSLKKLKK